MTIQRTIRRLGEADSTNRVAAEWARDGAPDGAVVVADVQTAGRGRLDRTWFARPGESLTFSVILRPELEPERFGLVNLLAAVAVAKGIVVATPESDVWPRIKWPNDVLMEGRKVCGILSEVVTDTAPTAVVVGIGINVNNREFPDEIASTATSIAIAGGREVEVDRVLDAVLDELFLLYPRSVDAAVHQYQMLCDTIGRTVRVETPSGVVEDVATGVDADGGLVLEGGRTLHVGDVTHLR